MLFNPSGADVRRFFCTVLSKHESGAPLEPIEAVALDWVLEHPEYHADLRDVEQAVTRQYDPSGGKENPFLHLSMHLAIAEQLSINQPPGIRALFEQLARARGSLHDAAHEVMECLGETVWAAQRERRAPDGEAYLDCVKRRASR